MSRVGKKPVIIPKNVKVSIDGSMVTVEGPKGKLSHMVPVGFTVNTKDNMIYVQMTGDSDTYRAKHGLTRSLLNNMVIGVTDGYSKQLEIRGVGFKAQVQGKELVMQLGYSHPATFTIPDGISIKVEKNTAVLVSGTDKSKVGEVSAEIRSICLPEPYKGKGIRYFGEHVRHKVGKKVA